MKPRGWLFGISLGNLLFLYGPIAVLVAFSFNASRLSATWGGATLQWYRELLSDQALLVAVQNSMLVAAVSTAVAAILGVAAAVGLESLPLRKQRIIEGVLLTPLIVPEVMLGVALMLFFVMIQWPLSLVTVTIGHAAFNVPVVMVIVRARLRKLDPHLLEAAYDLGATPWQAFRRVTLPLLAPAVIGSVLLAFTISLDDFIVTFFTGGPGSTTLPLKVYSMIKSGVSPEINALSAVLVVGSMTLVAAAQLKIKMKSAKLNSGPFLKFCLLPFAFCLLTACQQASEHSSQTLHYFTWSDYVGPHLIEEFERQTGAKVVVDTFGSNEELLAKLQSGATGYDVAVPSDFMVSIMMKLGLLAELNLATISNADLMLDRLQHLPFDPDHHYSIPYLWGTVGIGYDSSVMSTPPDSWDVLWDSRYKGRISMLNDQREVFGMALRSLGASINSRDPAVIEQAKQKLLQQKPLVKAYTSENYDHLLASGEVALAHGWGGAVARAAVQRPSIKYVIPKEGGTIWSDCLVVLQSSRNKELAMRFVNYLLDRQVAAQTTNRLRFASSNREAKALVIPELRENPAVYPPESVFDRLEWMEDLGETIRLYDRGWTELKLR